MELTLKNSNKAYFDIKSKLSKKRKQIFELIQALGKATPQELVEMFNDSNINYNLNVASRFTELREAGLIKIIGNKLNNKSNKFNAIYAITTEEERIDIINQKYQELIDLKSNLINDLNLKISFWTKSNVIKELKKIDYKISKLK